MNTQTTEQARISSVKFDGYKIELTVNIKGKPVARLYKWLTVGKNKNTYKLIEGYYFGDESKREAWVKEKIQTIKDRLKSIATYKEAKKDAAANHPFKIGDALYSSWGYDQTNIDFFEVVEVLPKSVKIQPISQIMGESAGYMCEYVKPNLGNYTGETITRPVKAYPHKNNEGCSYYVSNGRHSLSLYDGREKGLYQSHYA